MYCTCCSWFQCCWRCSFRITRAQLCVTHVCLVWCGHVSLNLHIINQLSIVTWQIKRVSLRCFLVFCINFFLSRGRLCCPGDDVLQKLLTRCLYQSQRTESSLRSYHQNKWHNSNSVITITQYTHAHTLKHKYFFPCESVKWQSRVVSLFRLCLV